MLTTFILTTGWAFWGMIGAAIIIDILFLATDDMEGWAVFIAAGTILWVILFSDAFVNVRVTTLIAAAAAYLVLGVIWSIKSWYTYVVDTKKELRRKYAEPGYVNKTAKGNETFESYAKDHQPTAADNKQRITAWMALWPFSVSWWILTWPRRAFVWLYDRLSTLYDRISAHVWASS